MTDKPTAFERLEDAAASNKGLRLSAVEVDDLLTEFYEQEFQRYLDAVAADRLFASLMGPPSNDKIN